MRRREGLVASTRLLALLAALAAPRAVAQSLSPDEALWKQVERLSVEPSATQPYEPRFEQAISRRRILLERLRTYLSMYPGGRHRDAAIRIELNALFELGSLNGGALDGLCARTQELIARPPSQAALEEAAYWQMFCDRWKARTSASQPASQMQLADEPSLEAAQRRYVGEYPDSRRTPRLCTLLFEAAVRRADLDEMRRLAQMMSTHFPDHAVTASLSAQLRREDAVGKPFAVSFRDSQGREVDTASWRGSPAVIVAWASFSPASVQMLREIESARRNDPGLRVAGVSLDDDKTAFDQALRDLQFDWPQWFDGFGWAAEFARAWGVRELPRVFVITRDGRLLGTATDDRWRDLLRQAQQN